MQCGEREYGSAQRDKGECADAGVGGGGAALDADYGAAADGDEKTREHLEFLRGVEVREGGERVGGERVGEGCEGAGGGGEE